MSRLTPDRMAYTLNEARERLSRHRGAFVDLADRHAAAVLDLAEERDALAARLATYGQRGDGCSDHGSPHDDGAPR